MKVYSSIRIDKFTSNIHYAYKKDKKNTEIKKKMSCNI